MYIYNVTSFVHWGIHDAWLQWMKEQRMPAVVATGCFNSYQLVKVLGTDETEGATYAVQYFCGAKDDYLRFIEQHEASLLQESRNKWGDYSMSFGTLMEAVK